MYTKRVKIFEDFVQDNADMLGMSREEYTAHYLSEGDAQSDEMAYGQLERCIDFAKMIRNRYENGFTLDSWMYNKIAIAEDYLNTVFGALDGGDGQVEEGNAFGAARAKAIADGKKEFTVDGETYPVEGVDKEDKENAEEFASEAVVNEWGSSDQSIMNKAIHKDAGSPKKMPSPFDSKLRAAAEDAVDFYWDDWEEYETDRDGLIDNAVRGYLRQYFRKDWDLMVKMFEPA